MTQVVVGLIALIEEKNIKTLDIDKSCDWLIIGDGYTGLSAARKLSELHPNQKLFLLMHN